MVAVIDNRLDHADFLCDHCGQTFRIIYNREDMIDWLSGSMYIQDAMPYLTNGERELLLSGTCDVCFDKLFPPLDNDE